MVHVHLDFETRSPLDVKKVGGWAYSRHPLTDIISLACAIDDYPAELVMNHSGFVDACDMTSIIGAIVDLANDPDAVFIAHNAFFEQCIWRNIMVPRYGMPEIPVQRWRCTAAKAAAMSLPRDLESVGKALDLPVQKDTEGNKTMLTLSRPRRGKFGGEIVFWGYEDRPEDFETVYRYNITDVEVERLVDRRLPDLTPREQRIWFLDQEINFRGAQLDLPAVHQIMTFIETTVADLTDEFRELTDYTLDGPGQVAKFLEWMRAEGVDLPNLQAPTVDKVLKVGTGSERIDRALEIRRALSKISTSKYTAMLNRMDPADGKLRDILLYCAALTKRWGGRGVQVQNMPRGTVDSDTAIQHIMVGCYEWIKGLYKDLMAVYSSCIRGAFIASPGCHLFVGDFSAIEAMTLPWLAGQESTLDIFRTGADIYCDEASGIYNRHVVKTDKYERSVGKVAVLALGYQGGIGAFGSMARGYGVSLIPAYDAIWPTATEEEQRKARSAYNNYLGRAEKAGDPDPLDRASGYASDIIKQRWRVKNRLIVQYWNDIEAAAIQAVLTGKKQTIGGGGGQPEITYGMYGEHLLCRLPSGNCLVYPFAKISEKETPWGEKKHTLSYRTVDSQTYQFRREFTYGGKLVENITQAVARDLLADALVRVDDAGYPIVMHVHDEIVADVPDGFGSIEHFETIMAIVPDWAVGLPVKVEAWKGKRYKK